MLRGRFESAGEQSPTALREAYDELLSGTVERVGRETVAERTGIEAEVLSDLAGGKSPELELEDAAAILATDDDRPDVDAITAEARDILLMGMSTAVLDVERLAVGIGDELDPKEVQAKIEGRLPMSLDEYARLHSYIEEQKP